MIRCTNGQFFMSGKVPKTIYFLKGNHVDNSNLIFLGLEKQNGHTCHIFLGPFWDFLGISL